jgi:hypothetical protein
LGGELAALMAGEISPYEVTGALLAGLRGYAPSVLILEDLQWADVRATRRMAVPAGVG